MPDFKDLQPVAIFALFALMLVREVGSWMRQSKDAKKGACMARDAIGAHQEREDILFAKIADGIAASSELNRAVASTLQSFVQAHQSWQMEMRSYMHEAGQGMAMLLDRRKDKI